MRYWLFKKEPKNISIDHIEEKGVQNWHGVRNYQARNFMRTDMAIGDKVLVYHSNSEPSAVVGLAEICSAPYDDVTAQDPDSYHHDPKANPDNPIWTQIDIRFLERFPTPVSLEMIRSDPSLQNMLVIKRGMRLSIQPVEAADFEIVCALARRAV
jgi:predicted RNA-binding protein with PUA-like domain